MIPDYDLCPECHVWPCVCRPHLVGGNEWMHELGYGDLDTDHPYNVTTPPMEFTENGWRPVRRARTETILEEAARITSGDRQDFYGHPYDNHGRTARLWSEYLGVTVDRHDVVALNILQKLSRNQNRISRDSYTDIAGYARNGEQIMEREAE